ncbi:MAG: hypothetical protein LBG57_04255, partial [Treponema sp.]|nr:hypothetical protein [Treponema sp.]
MNNPRTRLPSPRSLWDLWIFAALDRKNPRFLGSFGSLQSGRRLPIIWAAVLPHHRAYRSVHGGSMDYV